MKVTVPEIASELFIVCEGISPVPDAVKPVICNEEGIAVQENVAPATNEVIVIDEHDVPAQII